MPFKVSTTFCLRAAAVSVALQSAVLVLQIACGTLPYLPQVAFETEPVPVKAD